MIKKIIGFTLFISLIVALLLYTNGYTQETFQKSLYIILRDTSLKMKELEAYKIPEIPEIKASSLGSTGWLLSAFVEFAQIIINVVNFSISVVNTLIYVFKFIGVLTYEIGVFVAKSSTITPLTLVRL